MVERRRTVAASLWITTFLGVTVGCGGKDVSPDCPTPNPYCDITTEGCQQTLFAATACMRHQSGVSMPPVRSISLAQFSKESGASSAGSDAASAHWTDAFQLLGLLPAGVTAGTAASGTSVDNIVAYYDPKKKNVTVIERPDTTDPRERTLELSHEFVHALQDAEVDLQGFEKKWVSSTDSFVANRALPEGEATVLSAAVLAKASGRSPKQVAWSTLGTSLLDSVLSTVQSSGTPFFTATLTLPYPLGTAYLAPEWLGLGQPAIDAMYESPLLSVVDWVDEVPAGGKSTVEPLDCHPTTAPAGFGGFDHDTLGVAGALGLLVSLGHEAKVAWGEATSEWRGDSVVVFTSDAGSEVAVAWRTRWATAASATRFADAFGGSAPSGSLRVTTADREVQVLGMSDATALETWSTSMQCGTAGELPSGTQPGAAMAAMLRGARGHGVPSARVMLP
jgi:hypothetical protein